jgi:hypothetical protein
MFFKRIKNLRYLFLCIQNTLFQFLMFWAGQSKCLYKGHKIRHIYCYFFVFYQYCLYCVDIKHHLTNMFKLPLSSLSKTSPYFLKCISKFKSRSKLCYNDININIFVQHFTNTCISENFGTNSDTETVQRLHIREHDTLFSGEVIFLSS